MTIMLRFGEVILPEIHKVTSAQRPNNSCQVSQFAQFFILY